MSEVSPLLNNYIEQTSSSLNTGLNNLNNSYINNNTTPLKQAALTTQPVNTQNMQNTKDSFVSSLKGKITANKTGLIAGAIAATGIAAGVIYGVKTGKLQGLIANIKGDKIKTEVEQAGEETVKDAANNIEQKVNRIIEEVTSVVEEKENLLNEAENKFKEVSDLVGEGRKNGFKEVKDESGHVIRRFKEAEGIRGFNNKGKLEEIPYTYTIMEELDSSGAVKRSTEYALSSTSITEYIDETGKYDEFIFYGSIPEYISKGVEELADGSKKIDKLYVRTQLNVHYYENCIEFIDKNGIRIEAADNGIYKSIFQAYSFLDFPDKCTIRNHKYLADGSSSEITDSFEFKVFDGKIRRVDHARDIDGIHKLSVTYYKTIKDDKWKMEKRNIRE